MSERDPGQPAPAARPPAGLVEAFRAYEQALMSDDVEAMDRLFAPGATTLRGDADGVVVGHDRISAFRRQRGGAPARRIVQTHVQAVDADHALVVAVTELERGGRGQQTQLWVRNPDGWQVSAAHVSAPAPALDTRIWRLVGDPLVRGAEDAALTGETVAVKDVYAVAGQRRGAGNPTWLGSVPTEHGNAWAVNNLLDHGVSLRGISRTDEFAYSLAGTNAHYGAPPNPAAPGRIPGGSSSGSASAVSLGHASIGLGTDTGGSIRVPAAYQGLYGIRTTHGAVPTDGLLPLSPTFDTVGWFTRDADLLERVGDVMLPPGTGNADQKLVVVGSLLALAEPDVAAAVAAYAGDLDAMEEDWALDDLADWRAAFTTWQAWEAWQAHGTWVKRRFDKLGADVRGRFEMASKVTQEEAQAARAVVHNARSRIHDLVGDRVLVLPSASSVAPLLDGDLDAAREATLRLTCLAGIGGLPAVGVPLLTAQRLPCGACLVAGPGRDRDLLALAAREAR